MRRATGNLGVLAATIAITAGLVAGTSASARADTFIYFSGQTWGCGTSLASTTAELTFQCDGNLVLYRLSGHKALWATGTDGWGITKVEWLQDSNGLDNIFLVNSEGAAECWIPGFQASVDEGYASVQDDGNFVLYNAANQAQWATDTDGFKQGSTNLCSGFDYYLGGLSSSTGAAKQTARAYDAAGLSSGQLQVRHLPVPQRVFEIGAGAQDPGEPGDVAVILEHSRRCDSPPHTQGRSPVR